MWLGCHERDSALGGSGEGDTWETRQMKGTSSKEQMLRRSSDPES